MAQIFLLLFSGHQVMSDSATHATPWTAAHHASLSIIISLSLLKLMSIESVTPSSHLILCRPLLLPSVFPSIGVFSNASVLHRKLVSTNSLAIYAFRLLNASGSLI